LRPRISPEAAMALLDLGDMSGEELLARAMGGTPKAHRWAAKHVAKLRAAQDH
jgi:hypothetical protein